MRSPAALRCTLWVATALTAAVPAWTARADFLSPAESARRGCEQALAAEEAGQVGLSSRLRCHQAMLAGASARDFRNEVASLMAPRGRPSLDDLVMAALATDAAVHKSGAEPWGLLARCDIARKLRNADLMQTCLEDLRATAPHGALTERAATFTGDRAPLAVWLVRALLLLSLLGTLAHALWSSRGTALGLVLLTITSATARRALAEEIPKPGQPLSSFTIDDADPEASVPPLDQQNARPLEFGYFLQDLAGKAETAERAKDHAAAARYYRALTNAAPLAAVGPRKLCDVLQAAGDLPNAIVACRTALTRQGSNSNDYLHFVQVVLSTPGALPAGEHTELNVVLQHLENEATLGALPWMFRCEVALRFSDHDELATCTGELTRLAPRDPKTASFQWALAMQDHDRGGARDAIARARGAGMNAAGLQRMERATRAMTLRWLGRMAIAALAIALILGGSTFALRRASRGRIGGVPLSSDS